MSTVFRSIFSSLFIPKLWTPNNIKTLGWWDAADINTIIATGNNVTQWNDKSGNSFDMIANNDPETNTRQLNGLNVIDFLQPDYFEKTGFIIPSSGNIAFFMVTTMDTVDSVADSILSYNSTSAAFQFQSNNISQFDGRLAITGVGNSSFDIVGGPYTGPNQYGMIFDFGTEIRVFVDGTSKGSTSNYATKLSNDGTQSLRIYANTAIQFPEGLVAEVIIVEDCSIAYRQLIEGYLAWKWGLQSLLSVGHPFKNKAPTI